MFESATTRHSPELHLKGHKSPPRTARPFPSYPQPLTLQAKPQANKPTTHRENHQQTAAYTPPNPLSKDALPFTRVSRYRLHTFCTTVYTLTVSSFLKCKTPASEAKRQRAGDETQRNAVDGTSEIVKEFKSGTITLGIDDIGADVAADLIGARVDGNKVLVSATEDGGTGVAIAFRAAKANGTYRYFWLYRVKFAVPTTSLTTKGDSIEFSTPEIEGTILRRNKPDSAGKHPWKAEADEATATGSVITDWYNAVYEPTFTTSEVEA